MKTKIDLKDKTILITGAAGFIGAALTQRILREYQDCCVVGLDNLNDYYDPVLKEYRCEENSILLSIWLLRQVYVIVSIIRTYILRAILSDFSTSWKPAVTAMAKVAQVCNI